MDVKLNQEAIEHIEKVLSKGNDVLVQMRKDGAVIQEQQKKIVYRTSNNKNSPIGN